MNIDQKRKMINILRSIKEQKFGEDNLVAEFDNSTERNAVAKKFNTEGDFDSYINQHRGIEMTQMEIQALLGYTEAKPTQQDKFFVKYESTDDFNNNSTTVIKKLKEGQQFCWTAFQKNQAADDDGTQDDGNDLNEVDEQPAQQQVPDGNDDDDTEITVDDTIRITKSITFIKDTEGANILGDFLRKIEI